MRRVGLVLGGAVIALVFLSAGFLLGGLVVGDVVTRRDAQTKTVVLYCREEGGHGRQPTKVAVPERLLRNKGTR